VTVFKGDDTAATMACYEGDDSDDEEESGDEASGSDSMSDDDNSDDTVTKITANNPFAVLDDR
jgi:hypothetical protein